MRRALYRAEDLAAECGISLAGAYGLMRSGEIEVVKIGRRKMVREVEFLRYIDSLPVAKPHKAA